ncbi:MAG: hypothetical protein JW937_08825 [Candidatus Omnitrophica bacterium]|nr:hypothetical protein [Candidatus Omnitrophota bacterium]
MLKMTSRALAFLLAFSLCIPLLPAQAEIFEDEYIDHGEVTEVSPDGNTTRSRAWRTTWKVRKERNQTEEIIPNGVRRSFSKSVVKSASSANSNSFSTKSASSSSSSTP